MISDLCSDPFSLFADFVSFLPLSSESSVLSLQPLQLNSLFVSKVRVVGESRSDRDVMIRRTVDLRLDSSLWTHLSSFSPSFVPDSALSFSSAPVYAECHPRNPLQILRFHESWKRSISLSCLSAHTNTHTHRSEDSLSLSRSGEEAKARKLIPFFFIFTRKGSPSTSDCVFPLPPHASSFLDSLFPIPSLFSDKAVRLIQSLRKWKQRSKERAEEREKGWNIYTLMDDA